MPRLMISILIGSALTAIISITYVVPVKACDPGTRVGNDMCEHIWRCWKEPGGFAGGAVGMMKKYFFGRGGQPRNYGFAVAELYKCQKSINECEIDDPDCGNTSYRNFQKRASECSDNQIQKLAFLIETGRRNCQPKPPDNNPVKSKWDAVCVVRYKRCSPLGCGQTHKSCAIRTVSGETEENDECTLTVAHPDKKIECIEGKEGECKGVYKRKENVRGVRCPGL